MPPRRFFIPIIICLYFLLLALQYAQATPFFEAADEAAHFLYVHNLLEDRKLPIIRSRGEIAGQTSPTALWAIESHQPPLYYAMGAVLISWTDRSDINDYLRSNDLIFIRGTTAHNHNKWLHTPTSPTAQTHLAIWTLRLYSMALGIMTLVFIYLTVREVFGGSYIPAAAMLLVASIPTFVSISASINNDNLVTSLYSAGIYGLVRIWRRDDIKRSDMVFLSVVIAAIALTKITGLSLILIVYCGLLYGAYRGDYARKTACKTARRLIVISAGAALVFAGWWYIRNWTLYGDPLALSATRSLWGREYEIAATSGDISAELRRIGRSFWLMIGHLHNPVTGPTWVYVYALTITIVGLIGAAFRKPQTNLQRRALILFTSVCVLVVTVLLIGTRSVDISYGRLLFPALIGFAPLLVWGWGAFLGRFAVLLVIPLSVMAILVSMMTLPRAYPRLETIDLLPDDLQGLNVNAGELELLAYDVREDVVHDGETLTFDLYLQGSHPANPALLVTAVDSVSLERLGHVEVYPGIAPTDTLDTDKTYHAQIGLPIDELPETPISPSQVMIQVVWHSPVLDEDVPLTDQNGTVLDRLLLPGPVLIDRRYKTPELENILEVRFGDTITLESFAITEREDGLSIDLGWQTHHHLPEDWILTVQALDTDGALITQADGVIPGYPSSMWVEGVQIVETRTLDIPDDLSRSDYTVWVGWYRLSDFVRLPIDAPQARDNLFPLPPP